MVSEAVYLKQKKHLEGMTFGNYPFFKSVGYSIFISVASVFRILLFCSVPARYATMSVIMVAGLSVIMVYLFCRKYIIKGDAAGTVKG